MMRLENAFKVAENTDAMLAYWDKDLVCRFANASYKKWFGFSPQEMIDKIKLPQLLGTLYQQNLPFINNALKGKVQVFERDIKLPDGNVKSTIATYSPEIRNGIVIGFYVHVADVSPLKNSFGEKNDNEASKIASASDIRLNKVEYTLRCSLFTKFPGIEALAKQHFISSTKLKHDFKERYNLTIFNYYRTLQMQIAYKYLQEKLYSKTQIASMLGFASTSNFLICYKKYLADKITTSETKLKKELKNDIEQHYTLFIKQTPAAMAMFDTNFRLMAASRRWLEMYNKNNKKVEGKSIYELFPKTASEKEKDFLSCLEGKTLINQGYVMMENGLKAWLRSEMKPWYKSEKELGGITIFLEDVTQIKEQLKKLKEQVYHFEKCTEHLHIGMWEVNFEIRKSIWDNSIRKILDLPESFESHMVPVLNFYKEGPDRDRVKKCLDEAFTTGKPFDIKAKITTPLGNEKVVRVTGFSEFQMGICKKIYGTLQQVG